MIGQQLAAVDKATRALTATFVAQRCEMQCTHSFARLTSGSTMDCDLLSDGVSQRAPELWIHELKSGDLNGLQECYRLHSAVAYCLQLTQQNPTRAEPLLEGAFITLWRIRRSLSDNTGGIRRAIMTLIARSADNKLFVAQDAPPQ